MNKFMRWATVFVGLTAFNVGYDAIAGRLGMGTIDCELGVAMAFAWICVTQDWLMGK